MSCEHGNWAPCDQCEAQDRAEAEAYKRGYGDGVRAIQASPYYDSSADTRPATPAGGGNEDALSIYDAYKAWPADIRAKLSLHDLRRMDGWAPKPDPEGWAIDTSTGTPILVYEKCSVIESEHARYVLGLIANDRRLASTQAAGGGDDILALREVFGRGVMHSDGRLYFDKQTAEQLRTAFSRLASTGSAPTPSALDKETLRQALHAMRRCQAEGNNPAWGRYIANVAAVLDTTTTPEQQT